MNAVATGDLLQALHDMRAWETDERRGTAGPYLDRGCHVLVIDAWTVGNQQRIRVVFNERLLLFSCPVQVVPKNWKILASIPKTTT